MSFFVVAPSVFVYCLPMAAEQTPAALARTIYTNETLWGSQAIHSTMWTPSGSTSGKWALGTLNKTGAQIAVHGDRYVSL